MGKKRQKSLAAMHRRINAEGLRTPEPKKLGIADKIRQAALRATMIQR